MSDRTSSRRRLAGACSAALLGGVGLLAAPAGAATITVSPDVPAGWTETAFDCSTSPVTSQAETMSFVTGPGTPPAGSGSLKFDLTGKSETFADAFGTTKYAGTLLSDVEGAAYSTYVATASATEAPAFGFKLDKTGDGVSDEELVFYPSLNGTVKIGEWQSWDVLSATTLVQRSGQSGGTTTFAQYVAANPAAKITDVAVSAGCAPGGKSTANSVQHTDKITVDLKSKEADVYDLETAQPRPTRTGGNGYRMVAGDGGIFTFGARDFAGSTGDIKLNSPIVGGATDISDYDGYWIVAADGGVFNFGAEFYGSLGNEKLSSTAAEIEPTPSGKGYWIVLADGKVYTFGDANFFGDMNGKKLNKPIIGMAVTPTGDGYWLVSADGGIFNFGDARFFGSMGDKVLNKPVIDMAPAVDNKGYYLLGADGGVFTFGSADFKGSTGDLTLNQPVVAMLVAPTGAGYWLAASDGGLFTFGAVDYLGSMGDTKLTSPVLDLIN